MRTVASELKIKHTISVRRGKEDFSENEGGNVFCTAKNNNFPFPDLN
jgi:hypothetical protein